MTRWIWLWLVATTVLIRADEAEKISLPLVPDIQRADLYVLRLSDNPQGVLVLCPGVNGNGNDWLQAPTWRDFARNHQLDLAAISFASDVSLLQRHRGYYYAAEGSGELLLDGLRQAYHKDLPLLVYGFSGGAHFTSSFVEWKPDRVVGWCAYSAAWWERPVRSASCPPGLVACGENDKRLGASLIYFEEGRALGKPWLWLCAPHTAHSIYPPAEDFVRHYFAAILADDHHAAAGTWVDLDQKQEASQNVVEHQPSATGWLPDSQLLTQWQEVHQP